MIKLIIILCLYSQLAKANTTLREINKFYNSIPYADDRTTWGRQDYWATPTEFIAKGAGDCEDFALAKYLKASDQGFENLALAYVKLRGVPHMVMVYFDKRDNPFVYDNTTNEIKRLKEREGIEVVFYFNMQTLWFPGRGNVNSSKFKVLQDFISRVKYD